MLLAVFGFASLFMTQQNGALLLGALLIAAVVGVSKLGYDEFAMVKSGAVLRAYEVPVLRKGFFVVFVDLAIIAVALYTSIGLKYDDWGVRYHRDMLVGIAALVPTTTLAMFALLRIYRRAWSNASIDDVLKLATALIIGSVTTYLVARLTMPTPPAATFIVTYTLVILVLAGGLRASYRVLYHWNRRSNRGGDLVLIYGAGIGGTLALREILANSAVPMNPIGFIDDDPELKGRFVNGYPVLGCLDDLEDLVVGQKARGVVIASHKIPIARVQSAREVCESLGTWMRVFSVNFTNVDGVEGDSDAA